MGISVVVNEDNYEKIKLAAHKNRRTIGNELAMILDKHFDEATTGEFKATETKGRWGGDKAATSQPAPTPPAPLFSKPADAVSTSDKRYNRFVEFTNVNDQVCTQVVSGTEESLATQFAKNKHLKPRWVSPPLEQGMATMKWEIANEPSTRWVTDTSNSWKAL